MKLKTSKENIIIIGLFISIVLVLGVNIFLLVQIQNERTVYQNRISGLEAEVNRQRDDKNTIRNLWEESAAQNDKLIIAQQNLINRIDTYISTVENSIRFINTRPELLPGANEERLTSAEEGINNELTNLQEKTDESLTSKQESKEVIDALYLNAGEEQSNRANPRTNQ